jgi:hypothetical protein
MPVGNLQKGSFPHLPFPHAPGKAIPTASRSLQTTFGATAIPSTSINFEGNTNLDGVLPPDTNGDIGPNHYVQWVNLHFQVYDRTGKALLAQPASGNSLWTGFGGLCETTNQGDPIVRYDRIADRWTFTQFAFNLNPSFIPVAPFYQCIAVSTTGDPTGTFFRYSFLLSNTFFEDYPKLGIWPDAYYMSANSFSGHNLRTFNGASVFAFDRGSMLKGLPATFQSFGPLGSTFAGLLPADLDGTILPPSGSPNDYGAVDISGAGTGNTFQIWKFHVDWTTPANSTFGTTASHTPNFNLTTDTYNFNLCNFLRNCIPQPNTTVGLAPISDRLMNRLQYRRFSDGHESLVANHTVNVSTTGGNLAGIRWYEIRGLSATPTMFQQGTYAPDADNRWMGSIAMDQAGDIALGYSVSSSSTFPSIRYTGRVSGDALGMLPQGEAKIVAGSGSQTSSFSRWGDYSMMAVDPADDCTFWYTQEYYSATSDRGWQTRVASFRFPTCSPGYLVGAVGTDAGLWVEPNDSRSWISKGGVLLGSPAIVSLRQATGASSPLYIVTGSDHNLYVRNDGAGWQPLTDRAVYCIDNPAALAAGTTLYVACQGSDHGLWHAEATIPSGPSLPLFTFQAWQSLGGILGSGPAIATISGQVTYFVVGTDQHIWIRTGSTGFSQYGWQCIGHPSVATSDSTAHFACHGLDDTLVYSSNTGSGWTPLQSLGGFLIDGTAVVETSSGPVFFAEGSNGTVWHRSISSGWVGDGGQVSYGVAASTL